MAASQDRASARGGARSARAKNAEPTAVAGSGPSVEDVVAARQPAPDRPGFFHRSFLMHLADVAEDVIRDVGLPMHEANAGEVARDAVRRGLRPAEDATVHVHAVRQRDDGLTEVTYGLAVKPTAATLAVSTPRVAAGRPAASAEPEYTADPVAASEAPVPARPVEATD